MDEDNDNERKPSRLSMNQVDSLVKDNSKNILDADIKKIVNIKLSDILKLKELEKEVERRSFETLGIYRPNMGIKSSGGSEYHIVLYNLNIFLNSKGDIVIPEGVSVINCATHIHCRRIRFPKTLSSIMNLNLHCDGKVNLKNVRFISSLSVEAKELILPYTLERIDDKGLSLYGSTVVKTERTPAGETKRLGSLGYNAIIDNREKKSVINISNRFCNIHDNSLSETSIMFREISMNEYIYIDNWYIRNYYPHYLYGIVDDVSNKVS
jgi:hypothetical protein